MPASPTASPTLSAVPPEPARAVPDDIVERGDGIRGEYRGGGWWGVSARRGRPGCGTASKEPAASGGGRALAHVSAILSQKHGKGWWKWVRVAGAGVGGKGRDWPITTAMPTPAMVVVLRSISLWFSLVTSLAGGIVSKVAGRKRLLWECLSYGASGTPLGASEQSTMTASQKKHTAVELPRPTMALIQHGADPEPRRLKSVRWTRHFPSVVRASAQRQRSHADIQISSISRLVPTFREQMPKVNSKQKRQRTC